MLTSITGARIVTQAQANPQNGPLKTVRQFLSSPAALRPVDNSYDPYPAHMVGGVPYPMTPGAQIALYDQGAVQPMTLKTLFSKPFGSTSR